jgi:hypothetical protein
MYLVSIMASFLLGGIFAVMIRTELATPGPTMSIPLIYDKGAESYNHVFTLHGHNWARHPYALTNGIPAVLSNTNPDTFYHGEQMGIGPSSHFDILPLHPAGGISGSPGDYLYRDMVPVHVYNGIWGILRVISDNG